MSTSSISSRGSRGDSNSASTIPLYSCAGPIATGPFESRSDSAVHSGAPRDRCALQLHALYALPCYSSPTAQPNPPTARTPLTTRTHARSFANACTLAHARNPHARPLSLPPRPRVQELHTVIRMCESIIATVQNIENFIQTSIVFLEGILEEPLASVGWWACMCSAVLAASVAAVALAFPNPARRKQPASRSTSRCPLRSLGGMIDTQCFEIVKIARSLPPSSPPPPP